MSVRVFAVAWRLRPRERLTAALARRGQCDGQNHPSLSLSDEEPE